MCSAVLKILPKSLCNGDLKVIGLRRKIYLTVFIS